MAHKNIHSVNIVLQLEYFSSWVPGWCPLNTAPQQNMINTSWKLKIPYLQWGFQGTFDVFGWNFQSQLQFWQHCYLWVVKYVCVDCFVFSCSLDKSRHCSMHIFSDQFLCQKAMQILIIAHLINDEETNKQPQFLKVWHPWNCVVLWLRPATEKQNHKPYFSLN